MWLQVTGGADLFIGFGGVVERPPVAAEADWYVYKYSQLIEALKRYTVRGCNGCTACLNFQVTQCVNSLCVACACGSGIQVQPAQGAQALHRRAVAAVGIELCVLFSERSDYCAGVTGTWSWTHISALFSAEASHSCGSNADQALQRNELEECPSSACCT